MLIMLICIIGFDLFASSYSVLYTLFSRLHDILYELCVINFISNDERSGKHKITIKNLLQFSISFLFKVR